MPKQYINGLYVKKVSTSFGELLNITIKSSELENLRKLQDEKGYIKLTIGEKKETDKFGNTHSVWLNDFVPDSSKSPGKPYTPPAIADSDDEEDLPF